MISHERCSLGKIRLHNVHNINVKPPTGGSINRNLAFDRERDPAGSHTRMHAKAAPFALISRHAMKSMLRRTHKAF